ncbi:MAG: TIGR00730 family Rossman fold protein [Bacteroidota bacterium]
MNICVFCGSGSGNDPVFIEAARELGTHMAKEGHGLVYGGADIGLMGAIADAVLAGGGTVIGIIPSFLFDREIAHRGISELIVVGSMHERKKRMAEKADAFVALPGGWGTLDELAEILTWKQLHLISAPVAILNTAGYYDHLLAAMKEMVAKGFLSSDNLTGVQVSASPSELLASLSRG